MIKDKWYSKFPDWNEAAFLGYRPGDKDDPFPHDLYKMLAEPIRLFDVEHGKESLKRFLTGPQRLFEQSYNKKKELIDIHNPLKVDESVLDYILYGLGLFHKYELLNSLSVDDKRKFILFVVDLWKEKGIESAYETIASLFTNDYFVIKNWFHDRLLLDEGLVSCLSDYLDAIVLADGTEFYTLFQIVDKGYKTLNRPAFIELLKLIKPQNERLVIQYCQFLDLFVSSQNKWLRSENGADYFAAVFDGPAELLANDAISSHDKHIQSWNNYVFNTNFQFGDVATIFRLYFLTDSNLTRGYCYEIDLDNDTLTLLLISSGGELILDVVGGASAALSTLVPLRDYNIRIHHTILTNSIHIQFMLDGDVLHDITTHNTIRGGGVGYYCDTGLLSVSRTEVYDINESAFVGPELLVRPKYQSVVPGETIAYNGDTGYDYDGQVRGGAEPYTYHLDVDNSGATLVSGIYTSGNPGAGITVRDEVVVRDYFGGEKRVFVVVTG